jgi:hypothetical protein
VTALRGFVSIGLLLSILIFVNFWPETESRPHAQTADSRALVGAWTLNKDLSERVADNRAAEGRDGGDRGARRGGRSGSGGGFGRRGSRGAGIDREEMARRREALREILNPPDHLTIVQTDNMIVMTGPDGRTTRLSPDGKAVTDESTKISRKTRWDAGRLLSEISGFGSGRITETYSVDPAHQQLRLVVQLKDVRRPATSTYVYEADSASR